MEDQFMHSETDRLNQTHDMVILMLGLKTKEYTRRKSLKFYGADFKSFIVQSNTGCPRKHVRLK